MSTTEDLTDAIVIRAYGPPDVLRYEPLPLAPLGPGEVRARTLAAAINHSDLEIRAGRWPVLREPAFPYVPGLEAVGEVTAVGSAVRSVRVGERVATMMQGFGGVRAERHGGYARHFTVAADALATLPAAFDPCAAAALGLGAVTAHQGLAQLGALENKRVLVTGATGGVGSNAVAIAAARGAYVIAMARSASAADYLRSCGASEVVDAASELASGSLDAILDSVGGALFEPLVTALREDGRYSVVGAMGGDRVGFSLWQLLRGVALTGYSSERLDGAGLRAALGDVFALHAAGKMPAPAWQGFELRRAAEAHAVLEAGGVRGRLLLVPG